MADESTLLQYWKSRETVLEMLTDRGYDVLDMSLTKEEFIEWAEEDSIETIKESLAFCAEKGDERTYVAWSVDPKLGLKISNILIEMEKHKAKRAIVVVDLSVTSNTNGIITSCRVNKIYIDYFTLEELQINKMKHKLVPKHILCSKAEKLQVYKAYGIKSSDSLPHMAFDDPAARYFGAVKQDLFKIVRDSRTQPGQQSISYRSVN